MHSALYVKPLLIPATLLPWACGYVVVLEALIVWFIWLDRTWVAWSVLAQLAIFHAFSWHVVGYFYPCLMFAILMIFPLSWRNKTAQNHFHWLLKKKEAIPAFICVGVFSLFQIIPKLMPGDTSITGEGRLFALHMFDSFTTCEVQATLIMNTGAIQSYDLRIPRPVRIHCDPITYLSRAHHICELSHQNNPHFKDLNLSLKSRRSTEPNFHQVVSISDFCSKDIHYNLFTHNDWIHYN